MKIQLHPSPIVLDRLWPSLIVSGNVVPICYDTPDHQDFAMKSQC